MLFKKFNLNVSYGQISVFLNSIQQPFNDWTQAHFEQGFAWRLGSVSFATLIEAGSFSIEILIVENIKDCSRDFTRAIEVPFDVPENEQIEIASISDSLIIKIPSGKYILRYELLSHEDMTEGHIRLVFINSEVQHFSVQREDKEFIPQEDLLISAYPAAS